MVQCRANKDSESFFLGKGRRNSTYYSGMGEVQAFSMFAFSKSQGKLSAFLPVQGRHVLVTFMLKKSISPQLKTIRITFRMRCCLLYKNASKFLAEKKM